MKSFAKIVLLSSAAILLMLSCSRSSANQEKWYLVTVQQQADQASYWYGTSSMTDAELATAIGEGKAITFNDLLFEEKTATSRIFRPLPEYNTILSQRVVLNSKFIVMIQPLSGDPREIVHN